MDTKRKNWKSGFVFLFVLVFHLAAMNVGAQIISSIEPVGLISDGDIVIRGSGFGSAKGKVEVFIDIPRHLRSNVTHVPVISSWSNTEIRFNIFKAPVFSFHVFTKPVLVKIYDSSGLQMNEAYYPFEDVKNDAWFSTFVVNLWKNGVVNGRSTGIFEPGDQSTRAEFIKMAVVASGNEDKYCSQEPGYGDVHQGDWFYPYVKVAWNLGWLDKTKTSFFPNNPINRAEVAKIISTALNIQDMIGTSIFSDVSMDDWFGLSVMRLANREIVHGYPDGTFKPANNINRAEASKVINLAFLRKLNEPEFNCDGGKLIFLVHGLLSDGYSWGMFGWDNVASNWAVEINSMLGMLINQKYWYGGDLGRLFRNGEDSFYKEEWLGKANLFSISFSDNSDLTLVEQANELGEIINRVVASRYHTDEIILIGHSMGGLAIRAYLEFKGVPQAGPVAFDPVLNPKYVFNRSLVSKVITISTPHQGSPYPRAVDAYLEGEVSLPTLRFLNDKAVGSLQEFASTMADKEALLLLSDMNTLDRNTEIGRLQETTHAEIYQRISAKAIATEQDVDAFVSQLPWGLLLEYFVVGGRLEIFETLRDEVYFPFFYNRDFGYPQLPDCREHDMVVCVSSQLAFGQNNPPVIENQHHMGSVHNEEVKEFVKNEVGNSGYFYCPQ